MAIGVLCEKQCYAGEEVAAFVGKQSDLDIATYSHEREKKERKKKKKKTSSMNQIPEFTFGNT